MTILSQEQRIKLTLTASNINSRDINIMIIFLRLRKSPQTPKKKSVKETPKYLKASIGIVYFYANSTPFVLQANI